MEVKRELLAKAMSSREIGLGFYRQCETASGRDMKYAMMLEATFWMIKSNNELLQAMLAGE